MTDTALYRGFARLLGLTLEDIPYDANDPASDMRVRIDAATRLLATHDFVHVHVKATDEAAHTKQPSHKRDVIAATDGGLAGLVALAEHCVVAVTGDHASPSTGALLHSGDPTPLTVAAPGLRADSVREFGERSAQSGELGRIAACELLPYLAGLANRPFFLGHRPGPRVSLAMPAAPEPMPVNE